jgi:hypothetical protein
MTNEEIAREAAEKIMDKQRHRGLLEDTACLIILVAVQRAYDEGHEQGMDDEAMIHIRQKKAAQSQRSNNIQEWTRDIVIQLGITSGILMEDINKFVNAHNAALAAARDFSPIAAKWVELEEDLWYYGHMADEDKKQLAAEREAHAETTSKRDDLAHENSCLREKTKPLLDTLKEVLRLLRAKFPFTE